MFNSYPPKQRKQLIEDLRMFLRASKDPEVFFNYYLGIQLNDFQKRVVRNTFKEGESSFQNLFIAGNRSGKTLLLALLHLYFNFFKKGIRGGQGWDEFQYQTFNISPVSRQSHQALEYYISVAEGNFSWEENGKRVKNQSKIKGFIKSVNKNMGTVINVNNSRFLCMSSGDDQGAKFQGLATGYLSYDECVLSYHLEKELGPRIYSRLADYGQRLDLITTPDEDAPSQAFLFHLYQDAKNGLNDWSVTEGTFYENRFLPKEQKEKFLSQLTKKGKSFRQQKKQMLEGKFIATGEKMFDLGAVNNIWNKKTGPTPALTGHEYIIVIDWGVAEKGDDTVMIVVDKSTRPYEIVNHVQQKGGDPAKLMAQARTLSMNYNNAIMVMDATSLGGTTFYRMLSDLNPIPFGKNPDDKNKGLTYLQMLLNYNRKFHYNEDGDIIEDNPDFGLIRSYYIPEMGNQLSLYTLKFDKKLRQDYVMVLAMLSWFLEYKEQVSTPKTIKLNLWK